MSLGFLLSSSLNEYRELYLKFQELSYERGFNPLAKRSNELQVCSGSKNLETNKIVKFVKFWLHYKYSYYYYTTVTSNDTTY